MQPLPTDVAAYHRARWRARLATALVAVPALYSTYGLILMHDSPFGMVWFLVLAAVVVVTWFWVLPSWRRSFRLRPVVLPLDPTPGQVYGNPDLDLPPGRHRGLTGDERPPSRW